MRIDQQRAKCAAGCIASVDPKVLENYAPLARGLPAMLMTVGLGQTIAFLDSRAKSSPQHAILATHLRTWLADPVAPVGWGSAVPVDAEKFRQYLAECDNTAVYYQALGEAIGIAGWLKRFATATAAERKLDATENELADA